MTLFSHTQVVRGGISGVTAKPSVNASTTDPATAHMELVSALLGFTVAFAILVS